MTFSKRYAIIVSENYLGEGNTVDFEEEYKQNRTAMKKCKKTETWIFIVFAVNIAVAGFYLFLAISGDLLSIIVSVLGLAGSALGLLSVCKRDSALAIAGGVLVIAEVGVMFFSDGISVLGVVEVAVFTYFAVANFLNIKKYRWLEQQDGFPNFEPRLKEYDMDRAQRNIKDPYAQKMEDMDKNNTHEMQEL
ncbi:hypothetical protein [Ruminococcus sp.]|uniref:hypothetical protein n=1 Tax=Ruminococcus sp. TaxID=41978 RepID=UPI002C9868FD|nr:hypothetical protein [Ruminococcus sp.]HOA00330.1 hypothetical protein [Ruminococcus sp.]HOH87467.1 hypothetical protein [Ruminococcus sp.]